MAHPIIKYRLTKAGRIPEYLCKDAGSFSGMYGVNTNKAGKIPKWTSPQETLYLGMACGDPDSDGLPDGLDGTVDSKDNLQIINGLYLYLSLHESSHIFQHRLVESGHH